MNLDSVSSQEEIKAVGIIGLGVVGHAIYQIYQESDLIETYGYDKYKDIGDPLEMMLQCHILILCLPTVYDTETHQYNKNAIYDVCHYLESNEYTGAVVLKSTVEPETTEKLVEKFPRLALIHNPEFLSARTAMMDIREQKHIVVGQSSGCGNDKLIEFINLCKLLHPGAEISIATSTETELMKIAVNSFYATKVQFFQ